MMNKKTLVALSAFLSFGVVHAAPHRSGSRYEPRSFEIRADRIAVDNVTKAMTATGHVEAVALPVRLRSESATRDAEGVVRLADPTELTTCTNHPGICHWSLRGEVEYQNNNYILGRNVWLEFYEIPIFWLPYFYYPLDTECALRVMPGYTKRWGGYIMTKYIYDICGPSSHPDDEFWLYGNTRLDYRYVNGIAVGDTVNWGLGSLGKGHFKIYYAWDEDYDRYDRTWFSRRHRDYANWESVVRRDRYVMELAHRWDPTERDIVRVRGVLESDTLVQDDFFRESFLTIENQWLSRSGNEVAWEHNENMFGAGVSVSGPLNEFRSGTSRLPEAYIDLSPMPVFGLPLNYETETRVGYLARQAAEYGRGDPSNPYQHDPGVWADYATFRLDSYHRLTAPFRMADVLSVVPRLGYRGTYWNDSGRTDVTGWETAGKNHAPVFRSILEGGVTFAGRARGWVDDRLQHLLEPYLDVLAQKAWYNGMSGDRRPYIFDSIDASVDWQDQFAGRSRNLPYTYYGVTPGLRNAWSQLEENGRLRTIFDLDVYAALQFNRSRWTGGDDNHRLANVGDPNYGKRDIYVSPGVRCRWFPREDTMLRSQFEYDPDYNKMAYGELELRHKYDDDFSWYVRYDIRDYRRWDFSSTPYHAELMSEDAFNWVDYQYAEVGFEQHPIDWFAWNPYIRWDCREGELDRVGAWFDYLTDCLGFRLIVEYTNEYTRIDGSEHEDDFHVGFFVYLRALGADSSDLTRW